MYSTLWIGLYVDKPCDDCVSGGSNSSACMNCRNSWRWWDGEELKYQHWATHLNHLNKHEPDDNTTCGQLIIGFADEPCDTKMRYICKRKGNYHIICTYITEG